MGLIFFDLDGVLTPKLHPLQLAEMVGREEKFLKILKRAAAGERIELEWMVKEVATIFTGVPESVLENAGKQLPVMKGARETIKELIVHGYTPIVVTSGIEQIAGAFAQRLGITEWYGNILEIERGKTTGNLSSSPLTSLQSKGDLVREISKSRSAREENAAVGNDVNDWSMFAEVGTSILFNPPPTLEAHVKWFADKERGCEKSTAYTCVTAVIRKPDLRLILPYFSFFAG